MRRIMSHRKARASGSPDTRTGILVAIVLIFLLVPGSGKLLLQSSEEDTPIRVSSLDPGGSGSGGDEGSGDDGSNDDGDDDGDDDDEENDEEDDEEENGSGGSSGTDEGDLDDAVQEATDEVLDNLAENTAHLARLDDDARTYLRETAGTSAIFSGLQQTSSTASSHARNLSDQYEHARWREEERVVEAGHDARETHEVLRSEAVGDPVRLSDGAYLTVVPMPVIEYHAIEFDPAPRYDSSRATDNLFGIGWFSPLDSRVIQGATRPPETDALLVQAISRLAVLSDDHQTAWNGVFVGSTGSGNRSRIRSTLLAAVAEAELLVESVENLLVTIEENIAYFRRRGADTAPLDDARARAHDLIARAGEQTAAWDSGLALLDEWETTAGALDTFSAGIEAVEEETIRARGQYDMTRQRNSVATRTGQYPFLGETGSETAVVIDLNGQPRLFHRVEDRVYRSGPGNHGTLHDRGTDRGWRWVLPDGSAREYAASGNLCALEDRNGHRLLVTGNDEPGSRIISINDERGTERMEIIRTGTRIEITVPGTPVFTFRFPADGVSRRLLHVSTPRGGAEYHYDGGLLAEIREGNDAETKITWEHLPDGSRVVAVRDPSNATERFFYPAEGIRRYRDADGVETEYHVENGRTVAEHGPGNRTVYYRYDEAGNLVYREDSAGYREEWFYDESGFRTGYADSSGFREEIERDRFGLPTFYRTDRGEIYTIERDGHGNALSVFFADRDGYTVTRTDEGYPRRITYTSGATFLLTHDENGRPIEVLRDDGQKREYRYDSAGRILEIRRDGVTIEYNEFSPAGRLLYWSEGEHSGRLEYDEEGNPIREMRNGSLYRTSVFDVRGLPVQHQYYDGTGEHFSYTDAGRLATHRTRRGARFHYHYDSAGRIQRVHEESTDYTYRWVYDIHGRIASRQNPDGSVTSVFHNKRGEVVRIVPPSGAEISRTISPGGVIRTRTGGRELDRTRAFDALGRLTREECGEGVVRTVDYQSLRRTERIEGTLVRRDLLDRYGRVVRREYPDGTFDRLRWNRSDHLVEFSDRTGGTHRFRSDGYGRVLHYTDPVGRTTEWTYRNNTITRRNPDQTVTRTVYDLDRRPRELGALELVFTPDNTVTITDDEGLRRTVRHDNLGRVVEQEIADAWMPTYRIPWVSETETPDTEERWTLARDAFGFPHRIRSPAGRENSFSWRPTGVPRTFRPPTPGASPQSFLYDASGRLTERLAGDERLIVRYDDVRREQTLTLGEEFLLLKTDPYGRVLSERRDNAGEIAVDRTYVRDAIGRVTEVRDYRAGITLSTVYDDAAESVRVNTENFRLQINSSRGDVSAATIRAGERAIIPVTLHREGHRTRIQIAGRIEMHHRRDTDSLAGDEAFSIALRSPHGRVRLADALGYTRDAYGRISGEATITGRISTYSYDGEGRLRETAIGPETPRPGDSYVHIDPATERRLAAVLSRIAPSSPRPSGATTARSTVIDRDPDGRVRGPDVRWDSLGRIGEMRDASGSTTTIAYDPLFNQVRTLSADGSAEPVLTVHRDYRGAPTVIETGTGDSTRFTVVEQQISLGSSRLTLRSWRTDTTHTGETEPLGRYRALGAERFDEAIELRINDRPLLAIDSQRTFVYFTDLRGTTRGVAVLPHGEHHPTYHRYNEPGDADILPGWEPEGQKIPHPPAVPVRRTFAGMDRFTDTPIYIGRNRALLPHHGLFTTPDPLLDGLDMYQYCDGDPVNHVDSEGLFIAPASTTYIQQDERYGHYSLGLAQRHSIRDAGCVLVSATRVINSVVGHERATPGFVNELFAQRDLFTDGSLLSTESVRRGIEETTGHTARVTSIYPEHVDMERVARHLRDDPDSEYRVVARIAVPYMTSEGSAAEYGHTLNVTGFTDHAQPVFADTSNTNREALRPGERVTRYDVYTTTRCPQFR